MIAWIPMTNATNHATDSIAKPSSDHIGCVMLNDIGSVVRAAIVTMGTNAHGRGLRAGLWHQSLLRFPCRSYPRHGRFRRGPHWASDPSICAPA
jgi:hypothetical protein